MRYRNCTYSSFAFLTSLAVPAYSQYNLKGGTRQLHSSNGIYLTSLLENMCCIH